MQVGSIQVQQIMVKVVKLHLLHACEDSEITFTLSDIYDDGFEATVTFDGTEMAPGYGETPATYTFCLVDGEYSYTDTLWQLLY